MFWQKFSQLSSLLPMLLCPKQGMLGYAVLLVVLLYVFNCLWMIHSMRAFYALRKVPYRSLPSPPHPRPSSPLLAPSH